MQETLKRMVTDLFAEYFGRSLPKTPPQTKAFAMALAFHMGKQNAGNRPVLYGSPHSAMTRSILNGCGLSFQDRCWSAEYTVVDQSPSGAEKPLLGCEAVLDAGSGVDYNFDLKPDGMYPVNGYVWTFRKLLHFHLPHLIFVARVNRETGDKDFMRLNRLEETLAACLADFQAVCKGKRIDIVLLPSSKADKQQTRIASLKDGEPPTFKHYM